MKLVLCAKEPVVYFHCIVKLFDNSDLTLALTLKTKQSEAQWLLHGVAIK